MNLGKSGFTLLIERPRTDDDLKGQPAREVVDAMLPRKASKLQVIRDRTANRLRWAGREC